MSTAATPSRRVTRSSSREASAAPAEATPARGGRGASRAKEVTSTLPSLLGAGSTAYGSPGQAQLARPIKPMKKATRLFSELAAKGKAEATEAENQTSDLPAALASPRRRAPGRRAAAPKARPSPILESAAEDEADVDAPEGTTSVLAPAAISRQPPLAATPHRGGGARGRRSAHFKWGIGRICSLLAVLVASTFLLISLAIPWYMQGGGTTLLHDIKYYHDTVTTSLGRIFTSSDISQDDLALLRREMWAIRQDQALTKRIAHGSQSAASQMAQNHYDRATQVNYFSFLLGANVDPFLTSPTHQISQPSWLHRFVTGRQVRQPNPPAAALTPWTEAGECWCAPPNPGTASQAQLGVNMAHNIIPSHITIEHPPASGLVDPEATPKDMELWVHVPDIGIREAIEAKTGLANDRKGSIPSDWVQIAGFKYERHPNDGNHIQSFPVAYPLERFADWGLSVNKAILRANTNYDGDYTCLYRVRMHGQRLD